MTKLKLFRINQKSINLISDVSLGLFLTMAMMSLKIWELKVIALPLFIILLAQTVAIILFIVFVVFRLLGKNYDAAVMCSGMMGHGLGATPNAMANMSSVCERYKHVSMKAFMIVPLSGAVLIDLVGIPYHTWLINMLS
ncbi:Glutamate permease [Providencia rustigianii]|nr:Glutamate permease [Providencia rustigianii]